MNNQEIQNQIEVLTKKVQELERISIQVQMEPTTVLYLSNAFSSSITATLALQPSQTYSSGSPSGSAPTGSIWMKDTGVLSTNEIHMYSGSGWVRMK